jgi:hypothetical protein
MTVRFVIDERSIDLNGLTNTDGLEVIERLLERVEDALSDGHGTCFDDELFSMPLVSQRSFWELCDPASPVYLPPEIRQRAAATFGRMQRWYEVSDIQLPSLDVTIDGGPVETTASIAWAHQHAAFSGLDSVACICARGTRRLGPVSVNMLGQPETIWFVESAQDMEGYFRWIISGFASKPEEIALLAQSAFKQLVFLDQCFDGIGSMSKPCRQLAPMIVRHLSILSDEGQRIFTGPWSNAPAEFGSFGVNISDENGNTKQNSRAKKERMRIFGVETLLFWWHSKIEPQQDRIHIYPNKVSSGGKIIVGIFCRHLTV